jgi:hypothetical protein
MANFDVAIGMDFATFDALIASIITSLPAKQFDPVGTGPYATTFTFTPTQPPTLSANLNSQPVLTLSNVGAIVVSPFYGPIPPATVSVSAPFEIQVMPNNTLAMSVGACSIDTAGLTGPISDVLNMSGWGLGGMWTDYLNQLLGGFSIPTFSLAGMNFLQVCESDNFFLLYGGFSPVVLPSPGTAWPPSTWFAAFDAAALSAVVAGVPFSVTGYWSHSVFSCSYSATPSILDLTGSGNQFSATFGFSGNASFTYHDPTPLDDNHTYGPFQFSGTVDVSIALTVQNTGSINVALSNANVSSLSAIGASGFFLEGLPLGEVYDAIKGRIASAINGTQFNYNGFTSTSFSVAGSAVTIAPQDVVLNTITGPDNVPLSILEFSLTASVDPSAPGT